MNVAKADVRLVWTLMMVDHVTPACAAAPPPSHAYFLFSHGEPRTLFLVPLQATHRLLDLLYPVKPIKAPLVLPEELLPSQPVTGTAFNGKPGLRFPSVATAATDGRNRPPAFTPIKDRQVVYVGCVKDADARLIKEAL